MVIIQSDVLENEVAQVDGIDGGVTAPFDVEADEASTLAGRLERPVVVEPIKILTQLESEFTAAVTLAVAEFAIVVNGPKLPIYVGIGRLCYDVAYRRRNIMAISAAGRSAASSWSDLYYDQAMRHLSEEVRLHYPHAFTPSKDDDNAVADESKKKARDPVRVHDYVLGYVMVESLRLLVGDIVDELPWGLVVNYLSRKCLIFSKVKLQGPDLVSIRTDWSEFLAYECPRLTRGIISSADFIANMASHVEKLGIDEEIAHNVGKSVAQIEAEKAAAAQKAKTAQDVKRANDLNEALTTSLDAALRGGLPVAVVAALIEQVQADTNVLIAPVASNFDARDVTVDELLSLLREMLLLGRRQEVMLICEACAETVRMLAMFATPSPLSIAS